VCEVLHDIRYAPLLHDDGLSWKSETESGGHIWFENRLKWK